METDRGLVLVDTGLGLHDFSNSTCMVRFFQLDFGIHKDPGNSALRQITRLGYSPDDVKHIIMTHLHFDHAGGLPDFPPAQVHVHRREYEAMQKPRGLIELAYDRANFVHNPPGYCTNYLMQSGSVLKPFACHLCLRCILYLFLDIPGGTVELLFKTGIAGYSIVVMQYQSAHNLTLLPLG